VRSGRYFAVVHSGASQSRAYINPAGARGRGVREAKRMPSLGSEREMRERREVRAVRDVFILSRFASLPACLAAGPACVLPRLCASADLPASGGIDLPAVAHPIAAGHSYGMRARTQIRISNPTLAGLNSKQYQMTKTQTTKAKKPLYPDHR
jgi:hypothetical protein